MDGYEVCRRLKADAAARTEKKAFGPGTALEIAVKLDRAEVRAVLDLA